MRFRIDGVDMGLVSAVGTAYGVHVNRTMSSTAEKRVLVDTTEATPSLINTTGMINRRIPSVGVLVTNLRCLVDNVSNLHPGNQNKANTNRGEALNLSYQRQVRLFIVILLCRSMKGNPGLCSSP
ncbi:hypothetical protein B0T21DRAFT_166327 [Apiosordaria backusii]|uniref:Uncharacterized protein n=1 Tax=Apiosordaria backusii TaxID=314023 RepID=A0AA40EF25_9PEZI|nr:hypothetical protein B0T21DRAFT_166327 [Apiosordaria backusii]